MTTLIDALKGLEAEMDAYDPGGGRRELDRYEFAAKVCTREWSEKLSEIIAEHERSEKELSSETKCKCGRTAEAQHTCPYRLEINDSAETCNCCDKCRYECAMDI